MFPAEWLENRPPCWSAKTEVGEKRIPIPETGTAECPVSRITPKVRQLLDVVTHDFQLHEATGATMFGPVIAKWPAWYADAVSVIQTEIQRETKLLRKHARN